MDVKEVCLNYALIKLGSSSFVRMLRKLDSHLPVMTFGNFLHPADVVKSLGVWFDFFPNFSFADHLQYL